MDKKIPEQRPSQQKKQPGKPRSAAAAKAAAQEAKRSRGAGFLNICLAILATIFCGIIAVVIYAQVADLETVREEHAALQELQELVEIPETTIPRSNTDVQHISAFDTGMREINPDYLCWIKIEDTVINYPVVRGRDNDEYLNMSFHGESNTYGALFMDYRCVGEYVPHIIIYGHNVRQGDLFGGLRNFLNEDYMEQHPTITLKVNDEIFEYEIFAARQTNIEDPAYFLDFSEPGAFSDFLERNDAPEDALQIITLSTCVSGNNRQERVIIQAALR